MLYPPSSTGAHYLCPADRLSFVSQTFMRDALYFGTGALRCRVARYGACGELTLKSDLATVVRRCGAIASKHDFS